MKKEVLFYDKTIKSKDLEVLYNISNSTDAKRIAELIISLSDLGLDYAIYTKWSKSYYSSVAPGIIWTQMLPLLFCAVMRSETVKTSSNWRNYHLFYDHWKLCKKLENFIKFNLEKDIVFSKLKIDDSYEYIDYDSASFLLKFAYHYKGSSLDWYDIHAKILNPEENLDGFGSVDFSKKTFHTLSVMFWIATLYRQQISA